MTVTRIEIITMVLIIILWLETFRMDRILKSNYANLTDSENSEVHKIHRRLLIQILLYSITEILVFLLPYPHYLIVHFGLQQRFKIYD